MVNGAEVLQKEIPFDIMATSILPRLPVKSLARFRCVCKQWCFLTYDPHFIMEQHNKASKNTVTLFCRDTRSFKLMLANYIFVQIKSNGEVKDHSFIMEFGDAGFYSSSNPVNGLICTFRWPGELSGCIYSYLFNPTTRQIVQLPNIKNVDGVGNVSTLSVALGFDDSDGVYKVVRSHNIFSSGSCYFEVLTVGTQEWRRVGEAPCTVRNESVVFLNGAIHWLVVRRELHQPSAAIMSVLAILAFDIKEEKLRFISIPNIPTRFSGFSSMALQKLGVHLCIVQNPIRPTPLGPTTLHPTTLMIWKMEDYAKHSWIQEYAIDVSSWADLREIYARKIRVIDIIGGKLLIQMCGAICAYDIQNGTLHTLVCDTNGAQLEALTESIVSPRSLV